MVHLELVLDRVKDSVLQRPDWIVHCVRVKLNQMIVSALDNEHQVHITPFRSLVLLLAGYDSYIIYFLFGNSLRIDEVEAVEVDVLVDIKELISFIEDLPSNVVVNLLLHLLVLLKGDLVRPLLVSMSLVLSVHHTLEPLLGLFEFVDNVLVSLFDNPLCFVLTSFQSSDFSC